MSRGSFLTSVILAVLTVFPEVSSLYGQSTQSTNPPLVSLSPLTAADSTLPGLHRLLPPDLMSQGEWQTLSTGQMVWRLAIRSPEAQWLRLHVQDFAPGNGTLTVYAANAPAQDTSTFHGSAANEGFWTNAVFSDTIAVEYQPEESMDRRIPFHLDRLSHASPGPATADKGNNRQAVAVCQLNASCYGEYADAGRAVARIQVENPDGPRFCTGWLVNTSSSSRIPYLLTTSHCVPNQAVANTMALFWNYRNASCQGPEPNLPPAQSAGGALLVSQPAHELNFAFLRLPSVPSNAVFLNGSISKLNVESTLASIGHPDGSYQRTAFLKTTSQDRLEYVFTQGLAASGSDGSPLFSQTGIVVGMHTLSNADRFVDACRAVNAGQLVGAGEWYAAVYPYLRGYLEDQGACSYSVNPQIFNLAAASSTGALSVVTRTGCAWTAVSKSPWITITAGAAGSGNGTAGFAVANNSSATSRSGSLEIAGTTVRVTQAGTARVCPAANITIGVPVNGLLSASCPSPLRAGRYSARYSFSGTVGQQIAIDAASTVLQPFLTLLGPAGTVLTQSAAVTSNSARIPGFVNSYILPAAGVYIIEVTSAEPTTSGAFRLFLDRAVGCAPVSIAPGQTVNGILAAADCWSDLRSSYSDYFSFEGATGQTISIQMTSAAMDPYLVLVGPTKQVLAENDDASGVGARIPAVGVFTLPVTGTYTIQATTYRPLETGSYTLRLDAVTTAPIPPAAASGPLRFVAVTACRILDTRAGQGKSGAFGPPSLAAQSTREIPVTQAGCGIPDTALAYSLNVTAIPRQGLSYLTIHPAGQARPLASTLNAFDGDVVANMAIVPAGTNNGVAVFVTDTTDVVIDINGYFLR